MLDTGFQIIIIQRPETGDQLESRGGSTFSEHDFTGRILGNMFFELFAPQTLKGVTTAIQSIRFGKIGSFTA